MVSSRTAATATFLLLAAGAVLAFTLPFLFPTRRPLALRPVIVRCSAPTECQVRTTLPTAGHLRVSIRQDGRELTTLFDGDVPRGPQRLRWTPPGAGTYYAALVLSGVRQPYRNRVRFVVGG